MIHVVRVDRTPRRLRLTRATLRKVAIGIANARSGEILAVHAERDHCIPALIVSTMMLTGIRARLPRRIVDDWHERVSAPASRQGLREPHLLPAH